MSTWDDVGADSDGDELLDWLWDLPDRYDVGFDDDGVGGPGSGPMETVGAVGVRKHLRRPGVTIPAQREAGPPMPPPSAPSAWSAREFDDRPTHAVDAVDGYDDDPDGTGFVPALSYGPPSRSGNTRVLLTVAAIVVVLVGVAGLAYALLHKSGSGRSHLAISNSPITKPTSLDQSVIPTVSLPATSDSSSTSLPTSTVTTGGSTPAVVTATGTTTTTPSSPTGTPGHPTNPPRPTTTTHTPPTTTPPTTTPPTTTPPTTTPPTTTPPTTTPPTTTPPTTTPPTTTPPTTTPPTTTPPTTTPATTTST